MGHPARPDSRPDSKAKAASVVPTDSRNPTSAKIGQIWGTRRWAELIGQVRLRGQSKGKRCSGSFIAPGPEFAAMGRNDGAADGEAHAGALGLGGVVGVEDVVCLAWG